jgi:CheY-like chemotaxis protein
MIEAIDSLLKRNISPLNHRNLQSLEQMKNISVLFIDDDYVNFSYFKELLAGITDDILRAVSLTQALQMLTDNSHFYLIILSASLPENFNNFALKKVKVKFPDIPVITLITHYSRYKETDLLEAGSILCVSRYSDRDHIIEVFNEVIEISRNAK